MQIRNDEDYIHEVFLSLGSNQGERLHHLADAIAELETIAVGPLRYSYLYETSPVGYLQQPNFLNLVVGLHTKQKALTLLECISKIEVKYGRVRTIRYGPRTIDIDILLYDNQYICFRDLQIPHPRMWDRAFVLLPLADIVPERRGLGGQTIRELALRHGEEGDVRNVGRFW